MTDTAIAAVTDHFSEYAMVETATHPLSAQAGRYADACEIDCAPLSRRCRAAPSPADEVGCAPDDGGWTDSEQREHLACLERELGLLTPKKHEIVTAPCSPCLRDCCAAGLAVSADSNACVCRGVARQAAEWFACVEGCADEPLTPGPNDVCGTAGDTYYVTPTLTNMAGSVVENGDLRRGSTLLVSNLTNPTGIAVDEAGNVFFGEVLSGPVRVTLRKRAPDGTIAELGTVVDTSAGYVSEGWAFSVAVSAMGEVAYTTPVLTPGPGAEGAQPGSIRTLGGGELVGGLVNEPAGLAFDGAGNLYFGTKDMRALRIELHKRSPDGTISSLGTVVESLSGVGTTWMFDLAATRAGDVYFNTPSIDSSPGDAGATPQLGSIRKLGGGVVVANLSEPTALGVDALGNSTLVKRRSGPCAFN